MIDPMDQDTMDMFDEMHEDFLEETEWYILCPSCKDQLISGHDLDSQVEFETCTICHYRMWEEI